MGTNDFYDLVPQSLFVLVIFSHLFFTDQYLPSVPPPQFSNLEENEFLQKNCDSLGGWGWASTADWSLGKPSCAVLMPAGRRSFRSNIYPG